MLKLGVLDLKNRQEWESKSITLPQYDVEQMRVRTMSHPIWLHFGGGNIFRGFIANLQQKLLNTGDAASGIIVAETFDFDMIDKIYTPFDNLTLSVGLQADGNTRMDVIASVACALKAGCDFTSDFEKLKEIAANPELQMMSFTITEKGYTLMNMQQEFTPLALNDFKTGPDKPVLAMSVVAALLYERYKRGAFKITLCSMDNCSHNGEKLRESVLTVAKEWAARGIVEIDFVDYLEDENLVAFPWSMIDKITPRPSAEIADRMQKLGIDQMDAIITDRNTYIAPFVNAEIPQYLVMEDTFVNGRPKLELAGVYMTDRDTVNKTERMKVTTCLNPLHTAMAVFGCLLGFNHIAKEMQDEDIKNLVYKIGYDEGLPVVTDPLIIHPKDFIEEVLTERLPNMYIPDMPQRIATDTSMKIPIRFGETMKAYENDPNLDICELKFIPLAIAAWFRYLLGVDDNGESMEISSDPLKDELLGKLQGIKFMDKNSYLGQLRPILANDSIFALDLVKIGLADRIEGFFVEMIASKGAVREVLHREVTS